LVKADLLSLEPELLLFLRQLRNIEVRILSTSGTTLNFFSLKRTDKYVCGLRHTTLQRAVSQPRDSCTSTKFLVFEQTAFDMPHEKKREGVRETDVLMAFPVDRDMQPVLRDRMTFNFLPIRSYGFPVCQSSCFCTVAMLT